MADLKIRVFKSGGTAPATTVTVPVGMLKIASSLIPQQAVKELHAQGIDIAEIIRISKNPDALGTIIEVEDHEKNERVVIAFE